MGTKTKQLTCSGSAALGTSEAMLRVYELAARMAPGRHPILLTAERGTGKESVARAIHQLGPRAKFPFVVASKHTLADSFMERTLFSAGESSPAESPLVDEGRLEAANRGILYLEDFEEFSLSAQRKLTWFLHELRFERPDAGARVPCDVRIIAATSHDINTLLDQGLLDPDLYAHLHTFIIRIPPLRERKSDILPMARHFLTQHSQAFGMPAKEVGSSAAALLVRYAWPGNRFELAQCMEHAALMCPGNTVKGTHLPATLHGDAVANPELNESLPATLNFVERVLLAEALRAARGNQAQAAQRLGITERMMGIRVKKHDLNPRSFRTER